MPAIKLFVKDGCARCPGAKDAARALMREGFDVREYDIGTADGLAEGAFYGVMSTPTVLVVDDEENPVAAWRGLAPTPDEVRVTITA